MSPPLRVILLGLLLPPLLAPAAEFTADRSATTVSVMASVSSAAHETILSDTLDRDFNGLEIRLTASPGSQLPPRWSLITDLALRALAHLRTGSVAITGNRVEFHGLSTEPDAWRAATELLAQSLPADMNIASDVTVMSPARPIAAYCRELFDAALGKTRLAFASGSAELRPSSHAALDRLLELATDCPGARIHIRGADDENLGRQRADAVAEYLVNHGLPAVQLTVGVSASVPRQSVYLSATL